MFIISDKFYNNYETIIIKCRSKTVYKRVLLGDIVPNIE